MFRLSITTICPPPLDCSTAGGFVTFEGKVRTQNEGRPVEFLEYEAFEEMAEAEGRDLLQEAKDRFELEWVEAVHRVGKLAIGETAVWIGCAAAHRREAFLACEFLIDELKHRLPIWKKEHYSDGPSEWVNLQSASNTKQLTPSELAARQIVLPEVGPAGQEALSRARVVVVGAGGLAATILPYLAGAGIGTLGIVEPDVLEASNLHRQILFGHADLGRSKARLAAEFLHRLHPHIKTVAYEERLTAENAPRILSEFDIVVDGTDSLEAKFALNDACQALSRPLVQASIYQFEGYVQTILPGGPCLRCLWPEAPAEGCVGTCAQAGVLGVTPGFFGLLQANEVLKLILGFGEVLSERQLLVDLRDGSMERLRRTRRKGCSCASSKPWAGVSKALNWEVDSEQVHRWTEPFVCLDLREEDEPDGQIELGQVAWIRTPLSRFEPANALVPGQRTLLVCATGGRSGVLALRLREENNPEAYSLKGGLKAISDPIVVTGADESCLPIKDSQ
ncbi:MAG: ThiF family adenylyltransferase [Fimbriimonadaceae bacterium]|nr:ThiF family adenylyltransferase [Fimbriimonadaceae bacterium]